MMNLINVVSLMVLLTATTQASPSYENCDAGTDVLRNDVVLTDIAFELKEIDVADPTAVDLDIRYYPEQVIPYDYRSSVYLFVTRQDGTTFDASGSCGVEFAFGSGTDGIHSSMQYGIDRDCLTETGDPNSWPKSYEGDLEYWYCIGETSAGDCDDVDAVTAGFDPTDRDSLRAEHYCKKTVYDFSMNVSSGGLDATASFVMEYIRDPIEAPVGPFFGANGAVQALTNPLHWAICDWNDLGDVQYEECFARVAVNPPPRVLDLSTATDTNVFSTVFSLFGATDLSLVSDDQPLTIDLTESEFHLFHSVYAGDYSVCDPLTCDDVTLEITSSLVVREFGDADVLENYHVALEGDMPLFDEASTQNCDEGFCTLVFVLNFESVTGARRQLFVPLPIEFHSPKLSQYRRLEEDATQTKPTKVTATRSSNGGDGGDDNNDWLYIAVVGGATGFVLVGALIARKKKQSKQTVGDEEKGTITIHSSSGSDSASM